MFDIKKNDASYYLLIFVLFFLYLSVTMQLFAESSESIHYKFNKGDKFGYEITSDLKYDMTMILDLTKVKKIEVKTSTHYVINIISHVKELKENGNAVIEYTIKRIAAKMKVNDEVFHFDTNINKKIEKESPLSAFASLYSLKEQAVKVTISPRGEIINFTATDEMKELLEETQLSFERNDKYYFKHHSLIFPNKKLKKGQKWSDSFTINNIAENINATNNTTYTYEGQENIGDIMLDKFTVATKIDMKLPRSFHLENQDIKGSIYFDRDLGRIESTHEEVKFSIVSKDVEIHQHEITDMKLTSFN